MVVICVSICGRVSWREWCNSHRNVDGSHTHQHRSALQELGKVETLGVGNHNTNPHPIKHTVQSNHLDASCCVASRVVPEVDNEISKTVQTLLNAVFNLGWSLKKVLNIS